MEVLGCIIKQIKLKLIDNKLEYKNNIYTECIDIFNDIAINLGYTYSVHNIKEKSSNHIVYTVIFDDNKTDIIPAEMFAKLKIEKLKEKYYSNKKSNDEVLKLKEKNRKNLTSEEKYKIYYDENQEKIRNKQKEYYQNNKEMFANNYKQYAEKNREQMLEYKKEYMKLYREINKEKIKAYNKKKED